MNTYGIDSHHHVIAANEGNCAALAAGYHLATGKVPVVYMQNSGEGNIINPVASLLNDKVYAIPVVFIVGWRDAEHSQRTSYATGKLLTEFFMKDAVDNGKIRGASLRFANVYSKNERFAKHILPHIVNSLIDNGKVVLLENSKINKRT